MIGVEINALGLPAAAATYAREGWAVFPCWWLEADGTCACGRPGCDRQGKHPLGAATPHGLTDATADTATIEAWWSRWPRANIGIRTGSRDGGGSGVWALDLDAGKDGPAWFDKQTAKNDDAAATDTLRAVTGGGGLHLVYRYGPELVLWLAEHRRKLGNAAGAHGIPGFDWRGDGGYIVTSPSSHKSGRRYAWETSLPPREAPEWLLLLVTKEVAPERPPWTPPVYSTPADGDELHKRRVAWSRVALDRRCTEIASMPEGGRNAAVNSALTYFGGLSAAGYLVASEARDALASAARSSGLGEREVSDLLRPGGGWDVGWSNPRDPELEDRPRPDLRAGPPPMDEPPPPGDEHAPDPWVEVGGGTPAAAADKEGPTRAELAPWPVRAADKERRKRAAELAPWHVRAVVERLGQHAPAAPVAPLPGGWGEERTHLVRPASELVSDGAWLWPGLRQILGGWRVDTVAVLTGHTGRGKTALAVQTCEAAAAAGAPVLYASMELGAEELAARLIAVRGRKGAQWVAVKRGSYPPEALAAAREHLVESCPHLYLWAPTDEGRTVEALRRMTRAVVEATGRAPLVVLDYVQRLAGPGDDDGGNGRRMAVSSLSGALRDLSRPGGLGPTWPGAAVLALSSVSRGKYEAFLNTDKLAGAADLEGAGKESGELEYDAPILLCMTSNQPADAAGEPATRSALVRVVKNREGSTGRVWFAFDAARGTFKEVDPPSPPLPRGPGETPKEKSDPKPKPPQPRMRA